MNGKQLAQMAKDTYGTDKVTPEEISYLIDNLRPSTYLLRNHKIRNHPLTFVISGRNYANAMSHRPWQVQIINDPSPDLVVIKSRQLGLSEIGVGKLIQFTDTHSYDRVKALYTFPTGDQMRKFVQTRINPLLESGYYSTLVNKDLNSQQAKQILDSYLYFRSSSKPSALEGIDIDYLAMDEYDRVPSLSEASALEALSSSTYKIKNRWSTPTTPNMGIHDLFLNSDQNVYLHKCAKCNYYNEMKYESYTPESPIESRGNILCVNSKGIDPIQKSVVDGTFQFVCQKCGEPLDRWYNGYWVAKKPELTGKTGVASGYSISQMNAVWITADELKRKELSSKSKQAFYNYVLGYPFEDKKITVQDRDVLSASRNYIPEAATSRGDYKFISVGIDWGNRHWVTIHGVTSDGTIDLIKLFSIEKSNALDPSAVGLDIQALFLKLAPFAPDIIVADIGDSGEKIAKLVEHYGKDRVFGCKYPSTPTSSGNLIPTWNENGNIVTVDKLMQNKRYIGMIKGGDIGYYQRNVAEKLTYIQHWKNVVIRDEEQTDGTIRQVITRKGDDHYAQASVYSMIGYEHLMDKHYGSNAYGFEVDWMQSTLQPTMPDVFLNGV